MWISAKAGSTVKRILHSALHFPLCEHVNKAFAVTFEQRPQTIFPGCSQWKHNGTIVRWITHKLILWTLLSVDSLVTTKHKKCVFQFSENWAFLFPIKPILREGKLLWSHLIRTNDRCCKQAECFNSDLRHWFASVDNYYVDWSYVSSQSGGRGIFLSAVQAITVNRTTASKNVTLIVEYYRWKGTCGNNEHQPWFLWSSHRLPGITERCPSWY